MSAANSMSIKNFNSTLKMEKEATTQSIPLPPTKMGIVKQGIVSILGSDSDKRNKAAAAVSIRRTLSADMSSKKWLSQNGFTPIKKIASSKELDVLGQDDVWKSIQNGTNKAEPTSLDVWSSILSQKKQEESSTLPPPYVHPLLKKSSSSLTEKSLEICTESLGSETGSEISLSSYPPSDTEEDKDDHPQKQQQQQEKQELSFQSFEEFPVVKFNHNKKMSSPPKSFPPPISSLSAEDNKPSVHMQSRRQNGRLIVEAVSVPPQNHFRSRRVDGRLVLTLITTSSEVEAEGIHQQVAEFEQAFDDFQEVDHKYDDEVEDKGNGTKGMQIVLEQKPRLSNGRINVNTTTLMMKQLMGGLEKKNHHITWPKKFNKSIKLIEEENEITPIPQSLPQISQLITSPNPPEASSFNACDYFWKKNPTVTTIVNSYNDKSTTKKASYEQQDLVLMRGNKGDINYLVPLLKGCKEQRRSLLIWEPYCIATS
ncbi:protein FAF-like, chloroplastic [Capsicum galapagoense]